jgi:hypothetical protein
MVDAAHDALPPSGGEVNANIERKIKTPFRESSYRYRKLNE